MTELLESLTGVLEQIVSTLHRQIELVKAGKYDEFDCLCSEAKKLADEAAGFDRPGQGEVTHLLEMVRQLRAQLSLTLAVQFHEAGVNLQKIGEGKTFLRAYKS
ncbi:MAG TPA: hypothetical protein ENL03_03025 [Phycisphaerae bacterium]|nr:hypothetical protein [Phycisphaerae bacterium]